MSELNMEIVDCNLCGHRNLDWYMMVKGRNESHANDYTIVKCRHCGLVYLSPRHCKKYINELYRHNYHQQARHDSSRDLLKDESKKFKIAQKKAEYIAQILPKKAGIALDIGCGHGHLLKALVDYGFEVQGLDIGDTTHAAKLLNRPVFSGSLQAAQFSPSSFDLIVLSHVVEHDTDPIDLLQRSSALLKPDGVLAIEVPNFEGLDAKLFGSAWLGICAPYHLYHFTPASLSMLINKSGLNILNINTIAPWDNEVAVFSDSIRYLWSDIRMYIGNRKPSGKLIVPGAKRIESNRNRNNFKELIKVCERNIYKLIATIAARMRRGSYIFALCSKI